MPSPAIDPDLESPPLPRTGIEESKATWTCSFCEMNISYDATLSRAKFTTLRDTHRKSCIKAPKTIYDWPVPVLENQFCCPFRYRGCLYMNKSVDGVRIHCANKKHKTKCLKERPGDTAEKIYGSGTIAASWRSLSGQDLGLYIEQTFNPINLVGFCPLSRTSEPHQLDTGCCRSFLQSDTPEDTCQPATYQNEQFSQRATTGWKFSNPHSPSSVT